MGCVLFAPDHASLAPSWQPSSAAALTCGPDYSCDSATDTVLPDVVCATDECSDEECCEPGEQSASVFGRIAVELQNKCRTLLLDLTIESLWLAASWRCIAGRASSVLVTARLALPFSRVCG